MNFSSALVMADAVTGSGELAVEMLVPRGFQIGVPVVIFRGFAGGGRGRFIGLSTRYSFASGDRAARFFNDLSNGPDDYVVVGHPTHLWSPTCGGNHRARLLIGFSATVRNDPGALFSLDGIEAPFTYREGIEWRRCGESAPLKVPPGQTGEWCGGPQRRSCAARLACEYENEIVAEGVCVDPRERVSAQPNGAHCGGYRGIPCQPDLVCRYATHNSVVEERLGLCTPALGNEGDSCGGYPMVPCAPSLFCDPSAQSCVFADGGFGSRCGEGFPACAANLFCNGSFCVYPAAGEGQPCDGPNHIACQRGLVCGAQKVCVR